MVVVILVQLYEDRERGEVIGGSGGCYRGGWSKVGVVGVFDAERCSHMMKARVHFLDQGLVPQSPLNPFEGSFTTNS
jgi:hypothetical protein